MVFSDLFFIFCFVPAFALCYALAGLIDRRGAGLKARNLVLVVFSLLFYAWGEPVYVLLMLGSVLVNYVAGRGIDRSVHHRRAALIVGLTCNLLILATFKYAGFVADCLNDVGLRVARPHIALPIGISFYTFQSISYLVDVYRRTSPAQRRFVDLLLYISMFPQLIAGPIVRYGTIADEINQRRATAADVAEGMYRFLIGLGKKVILANQLGEVATQFLTNGIASLSTAGAWVGIMAFTLQIFYDFSGYSDMAIGLGRCMGFHFNENFDHPYCCSSITDFWRRWHISLGTFFRDYVYIPLGGNRRHQALNILVVWFLTGLWHGASWNFIIWGLYFGLIVSVEKYTVLRWKYVPRVLMHVVSLLLVVVGLGIFYFDDFGRMTTFFAALIGRSSDADMLAVTSALTDRLWLWVVAVILCMPVMEWGRRLLRRITCGNDAVFRVLTLTLQVVLSVTLLVVSTALLVGATNNAFLYTRF